MPDALPDCLQHVVEAIRREERMTPGVARRILEQIQIPPEALLPWADFEHPVADSYGRKLVYDGGYFELMVMSWVDGDMSAIHDHGYTQWGAVKLFGPAEHATFVIDQGVLTTRSREQCAPGTVLAVGHDLIHQMGNVGQTPYLTLHLYGAYDFQEGVTADARLFELDEGKIQFTCGGVFFDLPEEQIRRREDAPPADFPTTLRHKVELLHRLLRKHGSESQGELHSPRERRLAKELFSPDFWQTLIGELSRLQSYGGVRRREIYRHILIQELRAAARMQHRLLENGLFTDIPERMREALPLLLSEIGRGHFGERYLEMLGEALGLEMSVAG